MSRKLLFFDVDSTLVDENNHAVPDSAKEALRIAHENGHLLYINTGRCKSFMQDCLRELQMDGYCYACGAHIEYRDEVLFERFVPVEDIRYIRQAMLDCRLQGVFQGPVYNYFDDRTPVYDNLQAFIRNNYDTYYHKERKSLYDDSMQVNKLITFYTEESDYREFYARTHERYQLVENKGGFTEILPLPYSKASCMDYLSAYFGIPEEDIFVFGDSPNDLPMMTHIGTSVCLGNGYDEVKAISDYVTTAIDDDGVYNAMRHFGII